MFAQPGVAARGTEPEPPTSEDLAALRAYLRRIPKKSAIAAAVRAFLGGSTLTDADIVACVTVLHTREMAPTATAAAAAWLLRTARLDVDQRAPAANAALTAYDHCAAYPYTFNARVVSWCALAVWGLVVGPMGCYWHWLWLAWAASGAWAVTRLRCWGYVPEAASGEVLRLLAGTAVEQDLPYVLYHCDRAITRQSVVTARLGMDATQCAIKRLELEAEVTSLPSVAELCVHHYIKKYVVPPNAALRLLGAAGSSMSLSLLKKQSRRSQTTQQQQAVAATQYERLRERLGLHTDTALLLRPGFVPNEGALRLLRVPSSNSDPAKLLRASAPPGADACGSSESHVTDAALQPAELRDATNADQILPGHLYTGLTMGTMLSVLLDRRNRALAASALSLVSTVHKSGQEAGAKWSDTEPEHSEHASVTYNLDVHGAVLAAVQRNLVARALANRLAGVGGVCILGGVALSAIVQHSFNAVFPWIYGWWAVGYLNGLVTKGSDRRLDLLLAALIQCGDVQAAEIAFEVALLLTTGRYPSSRDAWDTVVSLAAQAPPSCRLGPSVEQRLIGSRYEYGSVRQLATVIQLLGSCGTSACLPFLRQQSSDAATSELRGAAARAADAVRIVLPHTSQPAA